MRVAWPACPSPRWPPPPPAHAPRANYAEPAWRFTLQPPSMLPVMQHLHDESIRRQVWDASVKVGGYGEYDNSPSSGTSSNSARKNPRFWATATSPISRSSGAWPKPAATPWIHRKPPHAHPTAFLADFRQLAHYKAAKTGNPWRARTMGVRLLGGTPAQGKL